MKKLCEFSKGCRRVAIITKDNKMVCERCWTIMNFEDKRAGKIYCDICGSEEDLAKFEVYCSRCKEKHNVCGMCLDSGHGLDEDHGEFKSFSNYKFSEIKEI